MRYKGPGTNWWPIVLLVIVAIIALAFLYWQFFMSPPPAGVDLTPTPGIPNGAPTP